MAMQLTMGLHAIHKAGVIGVDISPANIEIEADKDEIVLKYSDLGFYLKAFDLSSIDLNKSNVKIDYTFKSRREHRREEVTQLDDWESLCYLLFAIVSELPWAATKSPYDILKQKEDFVNFQQWCGRIPKPFESFLSYVLSQKTQEVETVILITALNDMDFFPFLFTFTPAINL